MLYGEKFLWCLVYYEILYNCKDSCITPSKWLPILYNPRGLYTDLYSSVLFLHKLNKVSFSQQLVLLFQVQSAGGKYKDVVGFYPMNAMKFEDLRSATITVLHRLNKLGLNVIAISADGLSTNVKLFENMCGGELRPSIPNPANGKPLSLIFDPTHLFKNFYNNFLNKRQLVFPPIPGTSSTTASFE